MADEPHRIDRAQVLHVAKLARLTLGDEEVPVITEQLETILGYVAHLQEVDTDGVEIGAVGLPRMPLRPDEPRPSLPRDAVLAEAPETTSGGFVVPAFVED